MVAVAVAVAVADSSWDIAVVEPWGTVILPYFLKATKFLPEPVVEAIRKWDIVVVVEELGIVARAVEEPELEVFEWILDFS